MGIFAARQVVLLNYPFSDLSSSKLRPGVIMAAAGRGDWIVCQITSNPFNDSRTLTLTDLDFASGNLHHRSYVRPGKVFTAHESLIVSKLGDLKLATFNNIRDVLIEIIRGS
jgi:mRNA interferase MazF